LKRYTKRANFSLGDKHIEWLKRIARHTQRTQVQELRLAIEGRGKALGVPPPPEPMPAPKAEPPPDPGQDMKGQIIE
jgi:hypothetical protein